MTKHTILLLASDPLVSSSIAKRRFRIELDDSHQSPIDSAGRAGDPADPADPAELSKRVVLTTFHRATPLRSSLPRSNARPVTILPRALRRALSIGLASGRPPAHRRMLSRLHLVVGLVGLVGSLQPPYRNCQTDSL